MTSTFPKGALCWRLGIKLYLSRTAAAFYAWAAGKPIRTAAGTGRISYYLALHLCKKGVRVTVGGDNHNRAVDSCRGNLQCPVMNDNVIPYWGSMSSLDVQHADAFVTLTPNAEYNMVAAIYTAFQHIPKVISRPGNNNRLKLIKKTTKHP